jgi:hypothetical protein
MKAHRSSTVKETRDLLANTARWIGCRKRPNDRNVRQRLALLLLGLTVALVGSPAAAQADAVTQLPFTSGPLWLAADPTGQHVFVSGGPGTSSIVVLNYDGTIAKTITGEQGASQMAVDAGTHTLYAALHDANAISEIDTQTLTETTRFSTAPFDSPTSLVIAGQSPAGQKLWFSCADSGVGCVASAGLDGSGIASADLQGIGDSAEGTVLATDGLGLLALGVRDSSSTAVAVYDAAQDPPFIIGSSPDGGCANGEDLHDMLVVAGSITVACSTPDYVASLGTGSFGVDAEFPIGASPDSVAGMSGYVAAGRTTTSGPDIAVYAVGAGGDPLVRTPIRTWSLETEEALPAHALAFAPSPSRPSELFAVVANPATGHMDFHVLDNPTIETTTSLTPPQQTILAGDKATLTAQVTGIAPATGTVDLYATPSGGSKTLVTTGTVSSAGTVSFTVTPSVTTTYSAVLEAGSSYPSSTSPNVTVTVVSRSMPIAVSKHKVTYGGKVKLTLPGVKSGTVDLFATPNGRPQALVKKATVSAGEQSVTFSVSPQQLTTYVAEREDLSAASTNVTVSVRPLLLLAVATKRVSPQIVRRRGEKVAIGAGRKPALPGEPLTIEIDRARPHGGWTPVLRGRAQVGASGIVVGVLVVKVTGRYRAQARFKGDDNYTSVNSRWRDFRVG